LSVDDMIAAIILPDPPPGSRGARLGPGKLSRLRTGSRFSPRGAKLKKKKEKR